MTDKSSKNVIMSLANLPDHIQNACDWANMGWKVFPLMRIETSVKDPLARDKCSKRNHRIVRSFPGAG